MKQLKKLAASAAAITALALAFAGAAQALTTIGQMPGGTLGPGGCFGKIDLVQFTRRSGTDYQVRDNGVLTSWSTNAGAGDGQMMTFKVFRPNGSGGYTVVGHDGPHPLVPGKVNTFKIHIPVKISDVIGLNMANASPAVKNFCAFEDEVGSEEDVAFEYAGDAPDNGSLPKALEVNELKKSRVNVSATLLLPPELGTPNGHVSLGSITGGGSVVLEGNHLEEVTGVSFGGVPVKSYTVNDEHHITAVVGPSKSLAGVAASVTTQAGTATSTPFYFYSGCVVPKLKGKKLAVAKKKIKAAGCKVGKVRKVRGRHGKVVSQSPKSGALLAPGSKVSIKVGK